MPHAQARHVAVAIAALIDGMWLRGALSSEPIDTATAQQIITDYLQQQLSVATGPESITSDKQRFT